MASCFMCGKDLKQTIEGGEEGEHFMSLLRFITTSTYKRHISLIYLHLLLVAPGGKKVRVFSYSELRKATHDFSEANKIGEGGFGSVFRVICGTHWTPQKSVSSNSLNLYSFCLIREGLKMAQLLR
jgi:hypothetical protein